MSLGFPVANGLLVSSKVLDKLFADHGTFLKNNGRYWIDQGGKPDGHLEAPAVRLALDVLPKPPAENVAPIYKMYAEELNAEGVTTISTRIPEYSIAAFKLLESKGELPLRLPYGLESYFGNLENLDQLKEIAKQMGTGSEKLWVISVAPSAVDGAGIRSCTNLPKAATFSALDAWWPKGQCILDIEYKGAKGANIKENYFRNWIMKSGQYGARFANTHITGDRSIKMMLGMMDQIAKQYGPASVKGWAFDHCFLVDPADLPHAAKLGAMFSCYSQTGGEAGLAATWGDKVANTYSIPVKTMMKNGVTTAYESDGDKSKWRDLEWFMDRKDRQGKVWGPQERLDHQEVLRYFTQNGADYVLRGDKIGSLEAGKWADMAVLDKGLHDHASRRHEGHAAADDHARRRGHLCDSGVRRRERPAQTRRKRHHPQRPQSPPKIARSQPPLTAAQRTVKLNCSPDRKLHPPVGHLRSGRGRRGIFRGRTAGSAARKSGFLRWRPWLALE